MSHKTRIVVREDRCSGCLSCMTVCSMANEQYASLRGARIQVTLAPFTGEHQVVVCRQCPKPACAEACPEEAISRDEEGHLKVDYDRCTACGACIEACPFDAMFWNPISQKVIKCELCGGAPQCVEICPTGAIVARTPTRSRS